MAALATWPPEEIHVILEAVGSEIWLHWQKMHTQKRKENLVREKANRSAMSCHGSSLLLPSPSASPKQYDFITIKWV